MGAKKRNYFIQINLEFKVTLPVERMSLIASENSLVRHIAVKRHNLHIEPEQYGYTL